MNNSKILITNIIFLFILIVLFLSISFVAYYLTPHNYILYEYNKKTNKKISSELLIIQPKEEHILAYSDYNDKLLKLVKENNKNSGICLIISNYYKSENVKINSNHLIKLNNSSIIIKNNSNNIMKINLELFTLI
jgi:hypothetical protein